MQPDAGTSPTLAGLVARLQRRLRHGVRLRLFGPPLRGCPDCVLLVFESASSTCRPAPSPCDGTASVAFRVPASVASPRRRGGGCPNRRLQLALAEAFAEFSMSSGLGLGAADWSSVAGMGFSES